MNETRTLTRENFYEVGEWAGAFECWELTAPQPELRIGTPHRFTRAHLGDVLTKSATAVTVTHESDDRYEAGYRDGESSGHADWAIALGEVLPEGVDAWSIEAVVRYIREGGS